MLRRTTDFTDFTELADSADCALLRSNLGQRVKGASVVGVGAKHEQAHHPLLIDKE